MSRLRSTYTEVSLVHFYHRSIFNERYCLLARDSNYDEGSDASIATCGPVRQPSFNSTQLTSLLNRPLTSIRLRFGRLGVLNLRISYDQITNYCIAANFAFPGHRKCKRVNDRSEVMIH